MAALIASVKATQVWCMALLHAETRADLQVVITALVLGIIFSDIKYDQKVPCLRLFTKMHLHLSPPFVSAIERCIESISLVCD